MQSPEDFMGDAVERLEWDERKEEETPFKRAKQISRRTALTGGAAGVAALALQACGGGSKSHTASAAGGSGGSAAAVFGSGPAYKFTFVNHVTTNNFFVPTLNGLADAAKLLGLPKPAWTGSVSSAPSDMVNAINSAITAKVDGIATTLISPSAFTKPVASAMAAGIPVVAYNANETNVDALSYIGQDLFQAGVNMGNKIVSLVPSGKVALMIATLGTANLQPRFEGAMSVLKNHSGITVKQVVTGAAVPQELAAVQAWASANSDAKGMFGIDGGTTQGVATVLRKQGLHAKGWVGGGFDLNPITVELIQAGDMNFTIDQQPYLQGFLPTLQLYMYNITKKLTGAADVDTGLKFITKDNVAPYNSTKSRYEGTSTAVGVQS